MIAYEKLILDWQDFVKNANIIKRDYIFYNDLLELNKIVSFVWTRRVGKTYLMLSFIKQLIEEKKIELEQIVFLDFSLNYWENIDYTEILEKYKTLFPDKTPFFVFDEIQDIWNLRQFVLALFNLQYKIFLSWSNSKLLSSELSTHFRWRVYEYQVFPLTFKEILRFKWIEEKNHYSSGETWIVKSIINETLIFGNFPEIVATNNVMTKLDNLKTYFNILFYKDLLERYKIENEPALRYFLKVISKSYTKTININKIFNELQSQWIIVWKNTPHQYWEYVQNIFFVYWLENFYNPNSFKKAFLCNIGFNKILWDKENMGQSFENFVFLELVKRYNKVYYKKNWTEIDLFVEEKKLNIQVCYELNFDNFIRELKPFKDNWEQNILIYFNREDNLEIPKYVKLLSVLELDEIL